MGDFIVLAVIAAAVAVSLWVLRKDRKKGGCAGCSKCGSCASCSGCGKQSTN